MARFNEILVGRYNRALQKLLSLKGGPPAPQLASEIAAVFNLFNGVENRYLEQWQRFSTNLNTGVPAAGNRAAIRLRNPASSNVVAAIEKLTITEPGANDFANILYDAIATAMPTENATAAARNLDPRGLQAGSTCIFTSSINFGLIGTTAAQFAVGLNTNYDFMQNENQEICLAPGSQITIANGALVNGLIVSILWRERFLEDSERA